MYRIAIIEDDKPTSETFKEWLANGVGKNVIEQFFDLESGATAIELGDYDLIVSDIDLGKPGDKYGGIRIAKLLHGKRIPILIVSGLSQPDLHREILLALDAWDYLQKPVTESDFINQARKALQWRSDRLKSTESIEPRNVGASSGDPDLILDPMGKVRVSWRGIRVNLSMTQVRIVDALIHKLNQPVPFDSLLAMIESGRNKENLRVHIQSIRKAFKEADSAFNRISNVPMVGYLWRI